MLNKILKNFNDFQNIKLGFDIKFYSFFKMVTIKLFLFRLFYLQSQVSRMEIQLSKMILHLILSESKALNIQSINYAFSTGRENTIT